ncbi:MAG: glycosyltransferase family A protein [Turneriella sp.]
MARIKKTPITRRATGSAGNRFTLVIPVRNGGELLLHSIRSICEQTIKPSEILIYDTESTDGVVQRITKLTGKIPLKIFPVLKHQFDHGGTRNAALKQARFPWVLYLTQDAVCADSGAFAALLAATAGKNVVAAYGKQLPHRDANPLAATARDANYGTGRLEQNMGLAPQLGIKTWFCSNSFCVWNKATLIKSGGFAEKLILGEDMHAAARLIQAGGTVVYEPLAQVRHSHNYSAIEEFRRYFDIGVFHAEHCDLLFRAGNASKEGLKFVLRQAKSLWRQKALLSLIRLPFHVAAKFWGYKLGRKFTLLGTRVSRFLSMHKNYWPVQQSTR